MSLIVEHLRIDVIITHMHYDHVGTFFDFPAAQFHLQDAEMSFATGRYMRHGRFNHGYEVDEHRHEPGRVDDNTKGS
jgi:glyoxylase-like metal-dependent hydrolase (beta-lactamase superfamily II)